MDSFRIADVVIMVLVGMLTHKLYLSGYHDTPKDIMLLLLAPMMTGYGVALTGGYNTGQAFGYIHALRTVTLGGLIAVVSLVIIAFTFKVTAEFSRAWLGLWLIFGWIALLAARVLAIWYAKRFLAAGLMTVRAVVIGRDPAFSTMLKRLSGAGNAHIEVVLEADLDEYGTDDPALDKLADKITRLSSDDKIDDVLLALPGGDAALIKTLLRRLQHIDSNIDICIDQEFLDVPLHGASTFGGLPILRVLNRPIEGWGQVAKWLEDKVLGVFFLVLTTPIMLAIAIAIKLGSPGPVLFYQHRLGRDNQEITIAKFRTMHISNDTNGPLETVEGDPRVTPIGRLLRRFSLDELPQLFNVISGSMSLVGPRPHAVELNEEYALTSEDYWSRHRVKPGITGWAQVNGFRGETKTKEDIVGRVRYDIHYIENWSIWLDLFIIFRTVAHVIKGENAY